MKTADGEFSWNWESFVQSGLRGRENLRIQWTVVSVTKQQLRVPLPLYKECCLVLSFIMSIFLRLVAMQVKIIFIKCFIAFANPTFFMIYLGEHVIHCWVLSFARYHSCECRDTR